MKLDFKFVIIALIVFLLSYDVILQLTTKFTKIITIQDKYIVPSSKGSSKYTIVDQQFNVYTIDNASDYSRIQIGQTYKVEGYGLNIPSIGVFKRIYKF